MITEHTLSLCKKHGEIPENFANEPIERALYTAPFQVSEEEAAEIRFEAIRDAFAYHYQHNAYFRHFCMTSDVVLDDIKTVNDLSKIPLIPEHTFKSCPGPEQFVPWLTGINTDEMPWPKPGVVTGSYDEQIATLRQEHNILVRSTSGSSGIPSFLSRNEVTRRRSVHWKILAYFSMYPEIATSSELLSVTLWPLDFSWADLMTSEEQVHALLDKKLGIASFVEAMTRQHASGIVERLQGHNDETGRGKKLLISLADQLDELRKTEKPGVIWAPPFVLYSLCKYLISEGRELPLGDKWRIELGGGWKLLHEDPISEEELSSLANQALGIPEEQIHDIFGSTEGLGLSGMSCEGRYKHVPHTVLHTMVLDDDLQSVKEGEWGRFAYINPLIQSYPGFILTNDKVRMLSRCPVCDRPGPVFDSQISRMPGAEVRGCSNVVQSVIDERIS